MTEYIEREAAIAWFMPYVHAGESIEADVVISDLKGMKAPDVEPVRHGRWVVDGVYVVCSVCNRLTLSPIVKQLPIFKFCPNCGARMDEEAQNER